MEATAHSPLVVPSSRRTNNRRTDAYHSLAVAEEATRRIESKPKLNARNK